ncbi:hypothetical protein OPV22_030768 [Ensete ventricosum]|uniref:Uncharacterized protein n=1 Tax=Ensete ventricosum TaxID=4639 RepID=A0AAV8PRP7_ENSVE|nr:hypothetical protein OPV22_030768 [Ensete ventricosum]
MMSHSSFANGPSPPLPSHVCLLLLLTVKIQYKPKHGLILSITERSGLLVVSHAVSVIPVSSSMGGGRAFSTAEGGWPLGLQPVNVRIGFVRNVGFSGSHSFRTLIAASPSSSSSSSSGLDTESTGSFFHDRSSITLGSLIGITSILDLSNRSLRRSRRQENPRATKNSKTKTWFSLCSRTQLSGDVTDAAPSLGSFLEAERRASDAHQVRNNGVSITYELEGLAESRPAPEPNTVFSDGLVLPPPPPPPQSRTHAVLGLHSGQCFALMFPCMAPQSTE